MSTALAIAHYLVLSSIYIRITKFRSVYVFNYDNIHERYNLLETV